MRSAPPLARDGKVAAARAAAHEAPLAVFGGSAAVADGRVAAARPVLPVGGMAGGLAVVGGDR